MSTRRSRALNASYQRWHKEPVYTPEQQAHLAAKGKAARRVDLNGNPLPEVQTENASKPVRSSFTPFAWEEEQ